MFPPYIEFLCIITNFFQQIVEWSSGRRTLKERRDVGPELVVLDSMSRRT